MTLQSDKGKKKELSEGKQWTIGCLGLILIPTLSIGLLYGVTKFIMYDKQKDRPVPIYDSEDYNKDGYVDEEDSAKKIYDELNGIDTDN